jgi:hypothetical protein
MLCDDAGCAVLRHSRSSTAADAYADAIGQWPVLLQVWPAASAQQATLLSWLQYKCTA